MIRMKPASIVSALVLLFISWNLIIYLWLGRNQKSSMEMTPQLSERLNRLQQRLEDQMETNQQLLEEIEKQKQLILRNQKLKGESDRLKLQEEAFRTRPITRRQENRVIQPIDPLQRKMLSPQELSKYTASKPVIPVLVIACNRPSAIKRSLDNLLRIRPSQREFPIVVSQDCGHAETAAVIQSYGDLLTFIKQPDLDKIQNIPPKMKKYEGYYKISRHYKWALGQIFNELNYDTVLVVEDDLDVAVDFFEYFSATHHLLVEDETLWCVSAWNDNGKSDKVKDPEKLYRSDFFPGLGWMVTHKVWKELEPKWPAGFWDDWMRQPEQRRERACIRPEISRTDTFGKEGVSKGQYFEQHLKYIIMNKQFVEFTKRNLSHLKKVNYDTWFRNEVYSSPEITLTKLKEGRTEGSEKVRLTYTSQRSFETYARSLQIMSDLKSGVPRTAYLGVVPFYYENRQVYVAPPITWSGYDVS